MLTLDTQQLRRQRQRTKALEQAEHQRQLLLSHIRAKEVTVATDGGLCTSSLEQQLGTPLSTQEVLRRIRLMNPDLIFEVSIRYPDRIGIYVQEKRPHILALDKTLDKRMIVAMQIGMMPERTVRHVKRVRVPVPGREVAWQDVEEFAGQTRGWRTVLLRLLEAGLISPAQIDRYFPPNLNSRNWQRLTGGTIGN